MQFGYLIYRIFMLCFTLTPRQQFYLNQPTRFDYVIYYGSVLFYFLVAMVYAIVAPLVVPFAMVLFLIVYTVMKYQLRFVYETRIETGGAWFEKVFNFVCFVLALFQLLTSGAILLISASRSTNGNGTIESGLVFGLVIMTWMYWLGMRSIFKPLADFYVNIRENPLEPEDLETEDDLALSPLDNSCFDPVIANPLPKVWVTQDPNDPASTSLYRSIYSDVTDYVASKHIPVDQGWNFRLAARVIRLLVKKKESKELDGPPEYRIDLRRYTSKISDLKKKETLTKKAKEGDLEDEESENTISLDLNEAPRQTTTSGLHVDIPNSRKTVTMSFGEKFKEVKEKSSVAETSILSERQQAAELGDTVRASIVSHSSAGETEYFEPSLELEQVRVDESIQEIQEGDDLQDGTEENK